MRLQFDDFVFDSEARTLVHGGEVVSLTPKAFQLLEILLANRPKAVSKTDIINQLWPDVFVTEGNLPNLVSEIRTALGDQAQEPRYIRTIHRYGYAFCAGGEAPAPASGPVSSSCWLVLAGEEIPLVQGENLIGRNCEIRIKSTTVSRRHARIMVLGVEASLEDLGSKNGTFVRGRRIEAPARLADGDEIRVGSVAMVFRVFSPASPTDTFVVSSDKSDRGRVPPSS